MELIISFFLLPFYLAFLMLKVVAKVFSVVLKGILWISSIFLYAFLALLCGPIPYRKCRRFPW